MEVDSIPKDSWSAPVAAKLSTALPTSSGVPTAVTPAAMAASSVLGVHDRRMISGHSGMPAGRGKVSR